LNGAAVGHSEKDDLSISDEHHREDRLGEDFDENAVYREKSVSPRSVQSQWPVLLWRKIP
jgi:hypothetical protein